MELSPTVIDLLFIDPDGQEDTLDSHVVDHNGYISSDHASLLWAIYANLSLPIPNLPILPPRQPRNRDPRAPIHTLANRISDPITVRTKCSRTDTSPDQDLLNSARHLTCHRSPEIGRQGCGVEVAKDV